MGLFPFFMVCFPFYFYFLFFYFCFYFILCDPLAFLLFFSFISTTGMSSKPSKSCTLGQLCLPPCSFPLYGSPLAFWPLQFGNRSCAAASWEFHKPGWTKDEVRTWLTGVSDGTTAQAVFRECK
jgi:hypothetical protein